MNGILIPETVLVKKDSISIGRFEITNMQFRAYKESFSFLTGQDNYPAVVSKKDAESYTKWLTQKTGQNYRLPNIEEGKKLHKLAQKVAIKENTLNVWAGYDLTRNDASILLKKVETLKSTLLKKVGKYNPTKIGDALIYDLGGNVAEYYNGGIYGYSAYDFYDNSDDSMVESKFVGFRVIKE